ncbi:MAG: Mut7-C ubiquitin/RNAse domain-containing protein [Actinomycetota bacterium]|nr:Mut7-C ubiquitin/RNAse domain-containing protein [Actinomycetota bacterium]
MERSVELRVYAELNDFLSPDRRFVSFRQPLGIGQTVKDLIEAAGVPHTEVDAVIVNGTSVAFDHRPREDDVISVYPVFESFDISSITRLRPQPLRETRFVVDSNLGGLARYLRMLGFDALFRNDFADDEIARISASENRLLLTRDVDVLKRKEITRGYYVRTTEPIDQVTEIVRRFDLADGLNPFSRCLECNEPLKKVSLEDVKDQLPERAAREYQTFTQCPVCERVYWAGSHHARMNKKVAEILHRARAESQRDGVTQE